MSRGCDFGEPTKSQCSALAVSARPAVAREIVGRTRCRARNDVLRSHWLQHRSLPFRARDAWSPRRARPRVSSRFAALASLAISRRASRAKITKTGRIGAMRARRSRATLSMSERGPRRARISSVVGLEATSCRAIASLDPFEPPLGWRHRAVCNIALVRRLAATERTRQPVESQSVRRPVRPRGGAPAWIGLNVPP